MTKASLTDRQMILIQAVGPEHAGELVVGGQVVRGGLAYRLPGSMVTEPLNRRMEAVRGTRLQELRPLKTAGAMGRNPAHLRCMSPNSPSNPATIR